jgi:hypothetical protein
MASILYREGKGAIEFGIECERTECEPDEIESMLANGWHLSPSFDSAPDQAYSLPDDKVRQAAKEAGIDGWDIKRIKTLRAELEA